MRAALPLLFCASIAAAAGTGRLAAQNILPAMPSADGPAPAPYAAVAPAAKDSGGLQLPTINLPPTNSTWQIGPPLASDPEWMPKLAAPTEYVGWFGGIEAAYLKPKVFSTLTTPASFSSPFSFSGPAIAQPVGKLDWAGAPKISAGYRFADGSGELLVAYRFLASDGRNTLPAFDAAGFGVLRNRLNANTLDIDYVCPEYLNEGRDISPGYFRELKFGFGVRTASLYFDTQGTGKVLEQHVTSEFSGVGPRTFVELHKDIGTLGWDAYGRIDASGVVGPIKQRFFQASGGAPTSAGYDTGNRNTGVGIGSVEVGISYTPPAFDGRLRLTAAYTYEEWWAIKTDDSRAKLSLNGGIVRAELRY